MLKIGGAAAAVGVVVAVLALVIHGRDPELEAQELEGWEYVRRLDAATARRLNRAEHAEWNYTANITKENQDNKLKIELELLKEQKEAWLETKTYNWQDYQNYTLKRIFKKYYEIGTEALPDDKYKELAQILAAMEAHYATTKICAYKDPNICNLPLEPDISEIFARSHDPEELKHTWVEWHNRAGAPSRQNFTKYVELTNEAAKLNGYKNVADFWLSRYEVEDFEKQLEKLWIEVKPLYEQLHAYVRRKLRDKYGDQVVPARGAIPAHLLGNVWAQTWGNIESFTRPYPDKEGANVTKAMLDQGCTPLKMFKVAEEFFKSLNLSAMPPKFWENSIIEKPRDREIVCHASAWDFYDKEDFRIKMCTVVDEQHLKTVHHEMGHVQYYMQYKNQMIAFREGANPGFHEAIGDTIALSVSSPKHLRKVGLLQGDAEDEQTEINQLYKMGIDKIVFLPFGYLLDLFRYRIFRGATSPENYNCHFWKLREEMQGVEPPVNRTEEDFDAAAKYHIVADVEYTRYFVSYIIQFQFHRALCRLAGEYVAEDPTKKLVDCDIYQSLAAGSALANMLRMGSSRPWPDAMEALTGQRRMSADGLLEYFRPLLEWLRAENERTGAPVGWEPAPHKYCTAEQLAALGPAPASRERPTPRVEPTPAAAHQT